MKKIYIGLLLLLSLPFSVSAYQLFVTEVSQPYEVVPFQIDIEDKQSHLGALEDFPLMYEFTLKTNATLRARLKQKSTSDPINFGLMLVQVEKNGVSEVKRFNPQDDEWSKQKDKTIGMTFLRSDEMTVDLEPGTYRLEVNTPDNIGKYILELGEFEQNLTYVEKLSRARTTQEFFGYSIFSMLKSSLVYYPLGIIILLLLLHRTWKYRKVITNVA